MQWRSCERASERWVAWRGYLLKALCTLLVGLPGRGAVQGIVCKGHRNLAGVSRGLHDLPERVARASGIRPRHCTTIRQCGVLLSRRGVWTSSVRGKCDAASSHAARGVLRVVRFRGGPGLIPNSRAWSLQGLENAVLARMAIDSSCHSWRRRQSSPPSQSLAACRTRGALGEAPAEGSLQ